MASDCGWTTETLHQHFTEALAAQHQYLMALRATDLEALKAALAQSDHRLDGVNEWRKTVSDLISKTLTRGEALTFVAGIIAAGASFAVIWSVFGGKP